MTCHVMHHGQSFEENAQVLCERVACFEERSFVKKL